MKLALRGSMPNIPWTAMNTPAPRPGIQRLVLGPCTGTHESPEPSLQAAPFISSTPLLQNSITVCEYGKSFTCILFIHLFIRHIHSLMDMCMYNILICMYIYIYIIYIYMRVCIHCVCVQDLKKQDLGVRCPWPAAEEKWWEMWRFFSITLPSPPRPPNFTTTSNSNSNSNSNRRRRRHHPHHHHHHHHHHYHHHHQKRIVGWVIGVRVCVCVRACVSCPSC